MKNSPDIVYLSDPQRFATYEAAYLKLRRAEGRLLDDETVRRLPWTEPGFPNRYEWRVRAHSLNKLMRLLEAKPKPLDILDLGCGNGWLSARLAKLPGCLVTGLDVNRAELTQAARVFGSREGLAWVYGDIFEEIFPENRFHLIVGLGVSSYFPDLAALARRALTLLKPGGELHLLESPVFSESGREAARRRSQAYLRQMGVPEMIGYYHYHVRSALDDFQPRILHEPASLNNRLLRGLFRQPVSPFPWFYLRKAGGPTG